MEKVLKVENIWKSYGKLQVLKGISFDINEGETKVIFGPSGSGKSTLLRCINMLDPPDKGKVYIRGVDITDPSVDLNKVRTRIGMVFQHFNLFNHLTALDNVALGLRVVKKMPKEEARKKAMEALKKVRMEKWSHHYPGQLSGGQKQRVGIARALAMEPDIILFDEPTSALDPELIGEVLNVMLDLAKEKTTMLVVTHEMGFARSVASEMIFIDNGVVVERGTPEHFFTKPKTERVRRFLSKIGELYGRKGKTAPEG
ncbi:amino acid ABC transporter ATP-binding protein [Candidatus Bathyarchaeota archaeon]|nr:amino acid ABC transporter ATP-binding protein [Candidatus Bathyarchaeota archaeon]RLI00154.1 MAG: glutamine ABC transporter ATP-binding protein [Candidatus Bathyarchaeota archaeon]